MIGLAVCGYLCFGVVLILLGANQHHIANDLGLDLTQTGLLAAMLSLGVGIGVTGAGSLFDRFPRRPLFVGSTLLVGFSLFAIAPSMSFHALLILIALFGIGGGAYITILNVFVGERYGVHSAKPLAALHSATAIGAVLTPPLIGMISDSWHWTTNFHLTSGAHIALAVTAALLRFPVLPSRRPVAPPREPVSYKAFFPFALITFAYVGIETSMTIFATPYAESGLGIGAARGYSAISSFWFGLFAGRIAPLMIPGRLDARHLIASGLLASTAVFAGIGSARIELLFGAVGLAIGIVYPVTLSLAGQRFPHARGTAMGLAGGIGCLGGLAVPWLTGAAGDRIGIEFAIGSMVLKSNEFSFR